MKKTPDTKTSKDFMVLDITDDSVKSLYLTGDRPYSIKGSAVKTLNQMDSFNSMVDRSIKEALVQADAKSANTIVGLGGPNVFGFMLILKINRPEGSKAISEKEVATFYAKVKEIADKQAKQMWSVFHPDENDFVTLDLVVNSFELESGVTDDPVGKESSYVQIAIYCSYATKNLYQKVSNAIKAAGLTPLTITTTLYSQVKVISEKYKNYVLVDVGGEYTDIAVIFGNDIVQTKSFQIGGNYFTQDLAEKLNLDFKNAQNKKEAYSSGTLSEQEHEVIEETLYEAGKDWRSAFAVTLASMSGIKSFPNKILLTGGGVNLPIVEELLYEEDWRNSIPFSNAIELEKIKNDYWKEFVADEIKTMSGSMFFVPASLCAIKVELESNE